MRSVLAGVGVVLIAVAAALVYAGTKLLSFRGPPVVQDYNAAFHDLAVELAGGVEPTPGAWEELSRLLGAARERGYAALGGEATPELQRRGVSDALIEGMEHMERGGDRGHEAMVRAEAVAATMLDPEVLAFLDGMADGRVPVVLPEPPGSILALERPEIGEARAMARAMVLEMVRAGRGGDSERSLAMLRRSLALGECLMRDPSLIGHLVGIAITALACRAPMHEAFGQRATEPLIRGAFEAIAAVRVPSVDGALRGERFLGLDAIQRLPSGLRDRLRYLNRGVQSAQHNDFYDELERALRAPSPADQLDGFAQVEQSFEQREAAEWVSGLGSILRPAVQAALRGNLQLRTEVAGATRVLALELHRADHGKYPASWSKLDARLASRLPPDPFSHPEMGYRVLAPGEDAMGRAYLVYSFGYDGVDNQGVQFAADKGRFKAFRAVGRGFDFVLNAVDQEP